jgi:Tol biopolymer transport system component
VYGFSPDGKEIYYGSSLGTDTLAVPTLGGPPRRVVSGSDVVPSPDGEILYYYKADRPGIVRAEKSGLNEESVYNSDGTGLIFVPRLIYPGGEDLLAVAVSTSAGPQSPSHFYKINVKSHSAIDLGEGLGSSAQWQWAEPGKTLLVSRAVNGLVNLWKYNLEDRSLTQITFGTGPDYSPMPDPEGKGIYFVNGKSSGYLTAYHPRTKESKDIVLEDATEPTISPDGKRLMYVLLSRGEVWVSDIDGSNKLKIAKGETGNWSQDNFHLSFSETNDQGVSTGYIVGADGTGLRRLPPMGGSFGGGVWSPDQTTMYMADMEKVATVAVVWKWSVGSANLEKLVDNCAQINDIDPSGKYLLGVMSFTANPGIYEISIADGKCVSLLPGVKTYGAVFDREGQSFLYAMASRGEVTIYRQIWSNGKLIGTPQVALKVPFAFRLFRGGNAYDFSRDLSTIVYARPGGNADLYLLSQK